MTVSIWKIPNLNFATNYYGEGNYNRDNPKQFERSEWHGRGANLLGLKGRVDVDTLTRIMKGETLDGRCIGQRSNQTLERALRMQHSPGIDFTFAPPKDVSLLYYLGKDERIIDAHSAAVTKSLDWIENNVSAPRNNRQASPRWDGDRKLVIAKFNHDNSRDNDPHIHTHSLVANMVHLDDRWGALAQYYLYGNLTTIRFIYDSYLRQALRDLGYNLQFNSDRKNSYNVMGVSKQAVDAFSQRSSSIQEILIEKDFTNHKVHSRVEQETRKSKTTVPIEDTQSHWMERGKDWVNQLESLVLSAKRRTERHNTFLPLDERVSPSDQHEKRLKTFAEAYFQSTLNTPSHECDAYALKRPCSEREFAARSAVSYAVRNRELIGKNILLLAILRVACLNSTEGITIDDIEKQLHELMQENKDKFVYDEVHKTLRTPNIVHERQTFKPFVDLIGQNLLPKSLQRERLEYANKSLTEQQEKALNTMLASKKLLVCVEGYPGSGNFADSGRGSELPKQLINAIKDPNRPIIGVMTCRSIDTDLKSISNFRQFETPKFKQFANSKQAKSVESPIILVDVTNIRVARLLEGILKACIKLNPSRIVLFDNLDLSKLTTSRYHACRIIKEAGIETATVRDVDNVKQICKQLDTSILELRNNIRRIGASIKEYTSKAYCVGEFFDNMDSSRESRVLIRTSPTSDKTGNLSVTSYSGINANIKTGQLTKSLENDAHNNNSAALLSDSFEARMQDTKSKKLEVSCQNRSSLTPLLEDLQSGRCRIVIPNDKLRDEFNHRIREELVKRKELGSEAIWISRNGSNMPSVKESSITYDGNLTPEFSAHELNLGKVTAKEKSPDFIDNKSSLEIPNELPQSSENSFASIFKKVESKKVVSTLDAHENNTINAELPSIKAKDTTSEQHSFSNSQTEVQTYEYENIEQLNAIDKVMTDEHQSGVAEQSLESAPKSIFDNTPQTPFDDRVTPIDTPASDHNLVSIEIRQYELLQLTTFSDDETNDTDRSTIEAIVVKYDESTITFQIGESQQTLQQDDLQSRTLGYDYAQRTLENDISKLEELVLVVDSSEKISDETFKMINDPAGNVYRMSLLTDNREQLARNLEKFTSFTINLPNFDTSWTKDYQQENLATKESVTSYRTNEAPIQMASTVEQPQTPEHPLDFEIEISR